MIEVRDEKTVHQTPEVGRHKALLVEQRVAAILQSRNDACVGGRSTDAIFLQRLDQACLGVPWRGLSEMLLTEDAGYRHLLAFGQRREESLPPFSRAVHLIFAHSGET